MHAPGALRAARRRGRSGVAATELALVMPVLVPMILGIADFGLAYQDEMRLTSVLNACAQYAFKIGQNATMTQKTLTANVHQFAVAAAASAGLPQFTVTVSVDGGADPSSSVKPILGPPCYCPNVWFPAGGVTCQSLCAGGATAGSWVTVTGGFIYTPMLRFAAVAFPNPMQQSVTVRLR